MKRSSTKSPKGFRVTVYTIKHDPMLNGWFNFKIWRDGRMILDGAQTAFWTRDEAKTCGISYSWDIFEERDSWS